MPHGQFSSAGPAWTIRSVTVRTGDGPERLEQVYRRLLLDPPESTPAGSAHPAAPVKEAAS
jgi:hypothetical protein